MYKGGTWCFFGLWMKEMRRRVIFYFCFCFLLFFNVQWREWAFFDLWMKEMGRVFLSFCMEEVGVFRLEMKDMERNVFVLWVKEMG